MTTSFTLKKEMLNMENSEQIPATSAFDSIRANGI